MSLGREEKYIDITKCNLNDRISEHIENICWSKIKILIWQNGI